VSASLAVRREVVHVCRRLWERGLIAGQDGNVSVRLDRDRVLVTPAGMSKVDVGPADLVEIALDGRVLSRRPPGRSAPRGGRRGDRAPSSEVAVHLRIYQRRHDVMAVVHAHPPVATAFAVTGRGLDRPVLPELVYQLGPVPLVPYATPGTAALADAIEPFVAEHDALLMANHGAVTVAPTLLLAHQRMENLEHAARILLAARTLGGVTELTPAQAAELSAARARQRESQSGRGADAPRPRRRGA
jgi:L-fuculose-phosphate aldolase